MQLLQCCSIVMLQAMAAIKRFRQAVETDYFIWLPAYVIAHAFHLRITSKKLWQCYRTEQMHIT
jgi:hypothetical protein